LVNNGGILTKVDGGFFKGDYTLKLVAFSHQFKKFEFSLQSSDYHIDQLFIDPSALLFRLYGNRYEELTSGKDVLSLIKISFGNIGIVVPYVYS
jgi:hypothetical protein